MFRTISSVALTIVTTLPLHAATLDIQTISQSLPFQLGFEYTVPVNADRSISETERESSETVYFDVEGRSGMPRTLMFDPFDTSLGTLVGINVSYSGTASVQSYVIRSETTSFWGDGAGTNFRSLGLNSNTVFHVLNGVDQYSGRFFSGGAGYQVDGTGTTGQVSNATSTDYTLAVYLEREFDLSRYRDTGRIGVYPLVDFSGSIGIYCDAGAGDAVYHCNGTAYTSFSTSGYYTVEYFYTENEPPAPPAPPAVPLPATGGLLLAGLAALGRRRR